MLSSTGNDEVSADPVQELWQGVRRSDGAFLRSPLLHELRAKLLHVREQANISASDVDMSKFVTVELSAFVGDSENVQLPLLHSLSGQASGKSSSKPAWLPALTHDSEDEAFKRALRVGIIHARFAVTFSLAIADQHFPVCTCLGPDPAGDGIPKHRSCSMLCCCWILCDLHHYQFVDLCLAASCSTGPFQPH